MPDFLIYTLPESEITVSGGEQLSGITQGDGSHLLNETITLNSNSFQTVLVTDNDTFFADNDGNQSLTNAITYDGVPYAAGRRVEAEYTLEVTDPDGNVFVLYGFNIVGTTGRPFGSVEGLAFVDDFPPTGVTLTVTNAYEGPSNSTTPFSDLFVPPCFVDGTEVLTPRGHQKVERLKVGDLVTTLDRGPQPILWIGSVHISLSELIQDARLRPVRLPSGLTVSQQHRILMRRTEAELICGQSEVLIAAKHLAEAGVAEVLEPTAPVRYWHLMFEHHEILTSNGTLSESFRPGPESLKSLPDLSAEFATLFPHAAPEPYFPPARYMADRHEACVLMARSQG